jgi:hypothetical protein
LHAISPSIRDYAAAKTHHTWWLDHVLVVFCNRDRARTRWDSWPTLADSGAQIVRGLKQGLTDEDRRVVVDGAVQEMKKHATTEKFPPHRPERYCPPDWSKPKSQWKTVAAFSLIFTICDRKVTSWP